MTLAAMSTARGRKRPRHSPTAGRGLHIAAPAICTHTRRNAGRRSAPRCLAGGAPRRRHAAGRARVRSNKSGGGGGARVEAESARGRAGGRPRAFRGPGSARSRGSRISGIGTRPRGPKGRGCVPPGGRGLERNGITARRPTPSRERTLSRKLPERLYQTHPRPKMENAAPLDRVVPAKGAAHPIDNLRVRRNSAATSTVPKPSGRKIRGWREAPQ